MADIDRAVGRILRQKFRLGLFEHPYVDPDEAVRVTHTKENQELALQVAREGIVLLKNEQNLLPLEQERQVHRGDRAQCGRPAATARRLRPAGSILQNVVTVLAGVQGESPQRQGHLRAGLRLTGSRSRTDRRGAEGGARSRRGHRGGG